GPTIFPPTRPNQPEKPSPSPSRFGSLGRFHRGAAPLLPTPRQSSAATVSPLPAERRPSAAALASSRSRRWPDLCGSGLRTKSQSERKENMDATVRRRGRRPGSRTRTRRRRGPRADRREETVCGDTSLTGGVLNNADV
ncbi:hypothetical protein U9M48_038752, partial [Paspalum notatum var. saurae]